MCTPTANAGPLALISTQSSVLFALLQFLDLIRKLADTRR